MWQVLANVETDFQFAAALQDYEYSSVGNKYFDILFCGVNTWRIHATNFQVPSAHRNEIVKIIHSFLVRDLKSDLQNGSFKTSTTFGEEITAGVTIKKYISMVENYSKYFASF